MSTAAMTKPARAIDLEEYCYLLESSEVLESVDLSNVMIYKVKNAYEGLIILTNTTGEHHGLMYC